VSEDVAETFRIRELVEQRKDSLAI